MTNREDPLIARSRGERARRGDGVSGLRRVRVYVGIFILGLFVSGVTAFPLVHEVAWLHGILGRVAPGSAMDAWVARVAAGLAVTSVRYPFLAYGTDWLAFAHVLFALLFVGAWRDPVRNRWVLEFGLMACAAIFPLALIAGPLRGIPWFWRLGDCSFGFFGGVLMWLALRAVRRMEADWVLRN